MPLPRVGPWLLVLLVAGSPCAAQAVGHSGVEIERLHWDSHRVVAVMVRHSELGAGGLGADAALGLVPSFLPEVVLPFEAGLAWGTRVGQSTLVLKAGGAGMFLGQQVRVIPGAQIGAAVMLPVEKRLELRADLVRRRYWPADSKAVDMWSVGIGFAVRATRAGANGANPAP